MLNFSDYVPDGKYHMLPSGELLIRRVDESDKYRSYQCRAVNRLTGASLLSVGTARFSVTDSRVVSTPRPIDKQVSIHARKDQTVVLPCFAEGNPPPTYKHQRDAPGVPYYYGKETIWTPELLTDHAVRFIVASFECGAVA
uniref:Uncharacterized protein n=1 Tax=Timema bartmani TaxID=61472 RepID=A0A7R9EWP7_9NEOP|nr:unnamed protein product [Timema bartmani]